MDVDTTSDTSDRGAVHDRVYGGGRVSKRKRESALMMICSSIGSITLAGGNGESIRGREVTRGNSPAAIVRSKSILKKTQVGSKVRFARCASSDPVMFDEANIMEVQTCLHPKTDDTGNTAPPTTPRSVVLLEEIDDHADSEDGSQQYELMEIVSDEPSAHIAKRGPHFYAEKVRQHEIEEGKLFCSSFKYHKPVDDDDKSFPLSLSSPLLNGNHQSPMRVKSNFQSPLSQDSNIAAEEFAVLNSPQSPLPSRGSVELSNMRSSFGAYEPGRLTSPLAFNENRPFCPEEGHLGQQQNGTPIGNIGSSNGSFTDPEDNRPGLFNPASYAPGSGSERKGVASGMKKLSSRTKGVVNRGSNLVGFCFSPPNGEQDVDAGGGTTDSNVNPFLVDNPIRTGS